MKNTFFALFFVIAGFQASLYAQQQLSQTRAERLFQKGTELVAHSNYGAARNVFGEFLEEASGNDPRRGEAEYYMALAALRLNHADGEKLIDDFVSGNPSSPKAATAYYDLANYFYNQKSYSKASSYYNKVDYPALTGAQQNEAHFKRGYSLFNLKKLEEALEQFNFVKNVSSEFAPAANYYAGFIAYSNADYQQALTDLKKAESSPSYASVVPYLIANVYYKQKRYDELLAYINSLKSRNDLQNKDEIAMLAAEAYYFKGDYKNAAESYERFLADNAARGDGALLFRAGYSNYALDQVDKAIQYLGKAAAGKDSVSYYSSYYLGILYLKKGDKLLAINAFDYARRYDNDQKLREEATFQLGKVTYDAGRPEQAIEELEQFLKQFPRSSHAVEAKELLAQAYVNGNNFHKAIEYIESLPSRSLHIEQAYQKATYLKGAEEFNKNDYIQALYNLEKSLNYPRDPKYVVLASFWAGEAYSVMDRAQEAVRHYQRVISTSQSAEPEMVTKARYGLGYAHYNAKEYEQALYNFKEFVNRTNRNSPNHTDGLIRLADCYYIKREYATALDYYSRARNIGSPDNDYVLLQSGVINGIQKQYQESRNQLTSLIQSYPKSQYRDEALFQRAQFEIEQGNSQTAVEGLTQLIQEGGNSKFVPYAYMRRAASYFNLKQYEKTVADYVSILEQFPSHPIAEDVLLPLQDALNLAGKSADFEKYLASFKRANPDNKGLESIEFETAKNLYFDQQYQKAITSLSDFIKSYPESARVPEAKYYVAEAFYRLKDFEHALPVYVELNKERNVTFGNRVVSRLGELQYRGSQYENAIRSFKDLERMAANKKEQSTAWTGLMESYYMLSKYDSADLYARTIIEKGAVNAGAQNKASLFLGKTAFARGDYETAKDEFLNTLNTAQDEYGAEAKYRLAEIFYLEKNYKQMYETLVELTKDFSAYEEWVGRAFLFLSDYFVATDDFFNAKATLQSLIDNFPMKNIKDEARQKLQAIEAAEAAKQQEAEPDTTNNER